jgi:hypothetical protein
MALASSRPSGIAINLGTVGRPKKVLYAVSNLVTSNYMVSVQGGSLLHQGVCHGREPDWGTAGT